MTDYDAAVVAALALGGAGVLIILVCWLVGSLIEYLWRKMK